LSTLIEPLFAFTAQRGFFIFNGNGSSHNRGKEDVVARGTLIASSTSLVVRINIVTVMVLGSKIMVMRAIESTSLTEHLHPISGLIHDRSGVSYAIFFVTQSSNIHN